MASTSFLEADASSVIKHIAESQTEITHLTPLEISASVSVWHMMQNKNTGGHPTAGIFAYCYADADYIMPPIPPAGIAGAASFSGRSTIAHSVVRNIPATDAAFSRATRDTLVGSITPASNMFTYSSVRAL